MDHAGTHPPALARWHAYMASRNLAELEALIAPDCVFISPIVHTPQAGRALTVKYLRAAAHVLGNPSFRYVGEWHADRSAILEFECEIDGITINGIDMIGWNPEGHITSFKVMVRPLKAITMLHQMMGAQLMQAMG
jgi:hypothetical protein